LLRHGCILAENTKLCIQIMMQYIHPEILVRSAAGWRGEDNIQYASLKKSIMCGYKLGLYKIVINS
jgi:hypothetical protein